MEVVGYQIMTQQEDNYAAVPGLAIRRIAVLPIAAVLRPPPATTISVFGLFVVLRKTTPNKKVLQWRTCPTQTRMTRTVYGSEGVASSLASVVSAFAACA